MTNRPENHPHELISALLDGEATVPERAVVERHLRDCGECRALLGDLRILAAAGASRQPPPVPAGLLSAVRARLEAAGERAGDPAAAGQRWWTGLWRSPLPVAAAVGAVAVLSTLWIVRERAAPPLHAPPLESIGLREEVRADRAVPGEPEAQAAPPEREQVGQVPPSSRPPSSRGPAPQPQATRPPSPPPAGMATQEPPPKPPGSEPIAGLPRAAKGAAPAPTEAPPGFAAAGPEAGQGRELRFEFPEYSGSISEGGTITLREGEYRCALRIEDSPAVRAQIASLFVLASSAELQEGGRQDQPPEGAAKEGERGRISLRDSGRVIARSASYDDASRDLPSASAAEIRRRIRDLIQDRLRIPLEEKCGRLPGAGGPDPAD
jgi:hypothetical protein